MSSEVGEMGRRRPGWLAFAGWALGWAWSLVAGGGGLRLLLTLGPWPLTNGWFALLSGLSVFPPLAWAGREIFGVRIPVWVRVVGAVGFFIAGRVALALQGGSFVPGP